MINDHLADFNHKYRQNLVDIATPEDIPNIWRGTPIESFILAENFEVPIQPSNKPELLIATCIEFRYQLPIPRMYAYVIRRASGRLIGSEFSMAYVLSRGVKHLCLIGHNDCGMTKVKENAPAMVEALVHEGWDRLRAEEYIQYQSARYSIEDELLALKREYFRLKRLFRKLTIAPLFVWLSNTKLYIPKWYLEHLNDDKEPDNVLVSDEELLTLM